MLGGALLFFVGNANNQKKIVVFINGFIYFFVWLFQAYTNELEQKVQLLQEENARLRRQQQEVHYCIWSIKNCKYNTF
ncbi:hypothetical protein A9266_25210 [Vibrio tasmaniensis]|nr:hypothetical protein A9266_25210 [Vibrio tasmaniensis]